MSRYLCFFLSLLLPCTYLLAIPALAAHDDLENSPRFWNLPVDLDDSLVEVQFTVDSTWHLIEGQTKKINGRVWLDRPDDYRSIRATFSLPISEFVTGNSSRDSRMREVMHADMFPQVELKILRVLEICNPAELDPDGLKLEGPKPDRSCPTKLKGELNISGIAKEIEVPATVSRQGDDYFVKGKTSLRWDEYNVEDPSILIAKLQPVVDIIYELKLPRRGSIVKSLSE